MSESDAVDALRLPFYSSRHARGSHVPGNQFDLGNTRSRVLLAPTGRVQVVPRRLSQVRAVGVRRCRHVASHSWHRSRLGPYREKASGGEGAVTAWSREQDSTNARNPIDLPSLTLDLLLDFVNATPSKSSTTDNRLIDKKDNERTTSGNRPRYCQH